MAPVKICPQCGTEYSDADRFCPLDGSTLRLQGEGASLVGTVIADRYLVQRKLGEGGMGQVYLAEHVRMGRRSAVKVLPPAMAADADAISRFHREAANASRISHQHVAAIYDFGETADGLTYLAMEYVDGEPLTALLQRQGALPPLRAAELVRQAAEGLDAAHALGIVHRDLKPDNIMLARQRDGADCVKVVDFGIAKMAGDGAQNVTRTGLIVGTPEYMSPEQLAGDTLDPRSDVYSLGLVACVLLTGHLPFPAQSAQEALVMRLTERPRTLAELAPAVAWPVAVQRAIDGALVRDLARRTPSAGAFARALVAAVREMPEAALAEAGTQLLQALAPTTRVEGASLPPTMVSSAPTVVAGAQGRARRRTPMLAGIAAAAVIAAGGAGLVALRRAPAPERFAQRAPTSEKLVPPAPATHPVDSANVKPAGEPMTATRPVARKPEATAEPRVTAPATRDSAVEGVSRIDAGLQRLDDALGPDATKGIALMALEKLKPANRVALTDEQRVHVALLRATALTILGRDRLACASLRSVERDAASTTYARRVRIGLQSCGAP